MADKTIEVKYCVNPACEQYLKINNENVLKCPSCQSDFIYEKREAKETEFET